MKKTSIVSTLAGAILLTSLFPATTHAAPVSATININTSAVTSYNPDFRGLNNEPERTAIRINDPNFINVAKDYGRIGFLRWPGGTPTNSYSWKLGATDAEYNGQAMKESGRYYPQLYARRYQITAEVVKPKPVGEVIKIASRFYL